MVTPCFCWWAVKRLYFGEFWRAARREPAGKNQVPVHVPSCDRTESRPITATYRRPDGHRSPRVVSNPASTPKAAALDESPADAMAVGQRNVGNRFRSERVPLCETESIIHFVGLTTVSHSARRLGRRSLSSHRDGGRTPLRTARNCGKSFEMAGRFSSEQCHTAPHGVGHEDELLELKCQRFQSLCVTETQALRKSLGVVQQPHIEVMGFHKQRSVGHHIFVSRLVFCFLFDFRYRHAPPR